MKMVLQNFPVAEKLPGVKGPVGGYRKPAMVFVLAILVLTILMIVVLQTSNGQDQAHQSTPAGLTTADEALAIKAFRAEMPGLAQIKTIPEPSNAYFGFKDTRRDISFKVAYEAEAPIIYIEARKSTSPATLWAMKKSRKEGWVIIGHNDHDN